jgi:hypothetical protein
VPIENVRKLVCEGGPIGHSRLLEKAGIDAPYHGVLADALGRLAPGLR